MKCNNTKLPQAWLWNHSLCSQPSILTKKLEVISVVVSESECDILRAASEMKQLGLPHEDFHHLGTINRGWVLIWNTKRRLGAWVGHSLASFPSLLACVRHSQDWDPPLEEELFCAPALRPMQRRWRLYCPPGQIFTLFISPKWNSFQVLSLSECYPGLGMKWIKKQNCSDHHSFTFGRGLRTMRVISKWALHLSGNWELNLFTGLCFCFVFLEPCYFHFIFCSFIQPVT